MREYLISLRGDRKQMDVATDVGIVQQYYSAIENGEKQKDMSLSVMCKLAKAFDISVETILQYELDYMENKERMDS